ncbi:MAG TPA: glycosyltransferase family 2 protein, partial [Thermoanaerobaculia bacterium]|nr:glycosyltransferase family 2 protein [Thermoanaerobaculia bacterium]
MTIELSIVMPCLNEAETIEVCVAKARRFLDTSGIDGEVVVADNGSRDASREIAGRAGARVVDVGERGYGSALQGGIAAARGRYVIMGDADDSYDFSALAAFVEKLRGGADLVMGDRFAGGVLPGAMPPLHRWLGNPVLSGIGRLFFRSPVRDFHCGLRGFSKAAYERMELRTTGMEFASEMVVKATLLGMRVDEVPIVLHPDGRSHPPHLRSWRDGWRHLRFLLLYSPRWLFLYPGFVLMLLGAVVAGWLLPRPRTLGGVTFDVQTLLYAGMAIVIGFQAVL